MTEHAFPDGLGDRHAEKIDGLRGRASLVSLIVLGALMALAMTGWLAGARTVPRQVVTPTAIMTATLPDRLRNGEMFEMRIAVTASANIADATIAIPPALWRDMTINTMIPAAESEAFEHGAFRFHYGPLPAGATLRVKVDGQINPPLTIGTAGEIALHDGERRLGVVPVRIRVLP